MSLHFWWNVGCRTLSFSNKVSFSKNSSLSCEEEEKEEEEEEEKEDQIS